MEYQCAPVLLIGFNRPDFMAAQIAAVRAARPIRLYVAVDGPRPDRPDEAEKCLAVRECVKLIDWPCEVKTLFREKNLGCKMGVSGAITWFFENEEEGVVLEDDCRPSPEFFRFATEMLGRYRGDERIGAIAGFNGFNLQSDVCSSYHFSGHLDVWGWASWRRVWNQYDVEAKEYCTKVDEIVNAAPWKAYSKYCLRKGIREVQEGLNTWDFQFFLISLAKKWLTIVPKERLVCNVGFDMADATHTGGYNYYAGRFSRLGHVRFPLRHPTEVVCDERADRVRESMDGAIFPRGLTWLGCEFPCLRTFLSAVGTMVEKCVPLLFRMP